MPLASSNSTQDTNNPLVLGPVQTDSEVLITGQNLAAGTVLGRITASGKLTQSIKAANDGSETPVSILIHPIDATGGDAICQIYIGGKFNETLLVWGAGFTAIEKSAAFDLSPISLVTPT